MKKVLHFRFQGDPTIISFSSNFTTPQEKQIADIILRTLINRL